MEFGESEHSLSSISEVLICLFKDLFPFFIFRNSLITNEHMRAHLPYFFRGSLRKEAKI